VEAPHLVYDQAAGATMPAGRKAALEITGAEKGGSRYVAKEEFRAIDAV
jgi:hypothetical protein